MQGLHGERGVRMVGYGEHNRLDLRVGQNLLEVACRGDVLTGDLFGEQVAVVVHIARGDTLRLRQGHAGTQQDGPLDPDAHAGKSHRLTGDRWRDGRGQLLLALALWLCRGPGSCGSEGGQRSTAGGLEEASA